MNRFLNNCQQYLLSLGLATLAGAQTQELPPLPEKPLPAQMPNYASWQVNYSYTDDPGDRKKATADIALPQSSDQMELVRPEWVTVTRTDSIIQEQIHWSSGRKTEKWIYLKFLQIVEIEPGGKLVRLPPSYLVSEYTDYSQGDFSGFHWLKQPFYTGYQSIAGHPCFIFQTKAPALHMIGQLQQAGATAVPPKELLGETTSGTTFSAAIDAKTLLPVFLDDGKIRKTYKILPPPTAALQMPKTFASEFDDWTKKIREASRVPTPP
jgi:hypothetical protein